MNDLPPCPRTYEFKYGTTYRDPDGLEFAIVAKSMKDMEKVWMMVAPVTCHFNPKQVCEVRIKKP